MTVYIVLLKYIVVNNINVNLYIKSTFYDSV